MAKRAFLLIPAALCILTSRVDAQKKVVIMGSSTAAGYDASSPDSTWAGRTTQFFNVNAPTDTPFYNISVAGYDTYTEMPSNFIPPPGRPWPDPDHNVTKALSYNPDIVIINLPSNDIANGYSKTETMNNFRLLFSTITATGTKCYISTTQPRNDLTTQQRQYQRDLVDSIINAFGVYSIDFWNDLVTTDGTNMLKSNVKDPLSDIHLNDFGHYLLYTRVINKQIFGAGTPLPLQLINFNVAAKNISAVLQWQTATEEPDTRFDIQRSADGVSFENIYQTNGTGAGFGGHYTYTDNNLLPGNSYYRLRIVDDQKTQFSKTLRFKAPANEFSINKIYLSGDGAQLIAELNIHQDRQLCASVLSANGLLIHQQFYWVSAPSSRMLVPVAALSPGCYFLRISKPDGSFETKPFIKL